METCIVGCKLPHGLNINLAGVSEPVVLKGANASRILGGHGMTSGVPKEAFAKWLADHQWLPAVRNGSVFTVDNDKSARSVAKERRNERTGFEAVDPAKAPNGLTPENAKTLAQQRAENPDRNRQIDELDVA